jgi:hypothetical protein
LLSAAAGVSQMMLMPSSTQRERHFIIIMADGFGQAARAPRAHICFFRGALLASVYRTTTTTTMLPIFAAMRTCADVEAELFRKTDLSADDAVSADDGVNNHFFIPKWLLDDIDY